MRKKEEKKMKKKRKEKKKKEEKRGCAKKNSHNLLSTHKNQVRRMRLELTRSCDHYPLKVACIPISPPALRALALTLA